MPPRTTPPFDVQAFLEATATATALTACAAPVVPAADMSRLLHTDHTFSDHFIAHMLARNTWLEADLVDRRNPSST